jgi:hypothetical protein
MTSGIIGATLPLVARPENAVERPVAGSSGYLGRWMHVCGSPVRGLLTFVGPHGLPDPAPPLRFSLDWVLGLLLYGAVMTWLMRAAVHASPLQEYVFWGGLPLLYLPLATRAAWPRVAPGERLVHLIVLAELTFVLKVLFWPVNFAQFDEYLHWITASDILEAHRLFLPNSMLPVSPLFPGLEVVTTALVNVSGLPLFVGGNLVVAACRLLIIAGLYGFYSRISGSARLAAIGCLAYMGSSGYVLFDSQFAYETLAVGFLATILVAHVELSAGDVGAMRTLTVLGLLAAAVVLTHHITAFEVLTLLAGAAALQILGRRPRWRLDLMTAALCAAFLALWLRLIGNPLGGYIGPMVDAGITEFLTMLQHTIAGSGNGHASGLGGGLGGGGGGSSRQAFVASDGSRTPIWLQAPILAALPLTALLLANGFFATLARARGAGLADHGSGWRAIVDLLRLRWQQSWMLLIALVALIWPLSVLLRLTASGWQIGNRLSAIAFLGVGLVIGCAIVRWWQRPGQWVAGAAAVLSLTTIFTGGVVSGWGLPATHIGYKVEGDSLSLEPMGIDAALWTKQWLGIGNRFATDRFNSVLLGTYGRQDLITSLYNPVDASELFLQPHVTGWDRNIIKADRIDYLMTDLRLSTARPFLAPYFDEGSGDDPLDLRNLIKWNGVAGVSRVFDDGWISIYDVRGIRRAP